ncbi:MAG TPA: DUF58 domain-containing protein [Nitrospira sp.]|nr:DUF58 domain-containing protein [Nitrospira sp.]
MHIPAARIGSHIRYLATRRSIRLTSEGIRFLLFTIVIGVAAINTGNNLFYLLLAMMLSLVVISGLLSEQGLRRLDFHRHVPDLIMANDPTTVTLSVTNRNNWLPSFSLRLFDVAGGQDLDRGLFIDHLPAQRSVLLSYPILATARGRLQLERVRAETLFPFGLFLKRALYQVPAEILVGPPIRMLSLRFVDELVNEGQGLSLPRRGHGSQLYNLRLYQPGDDSRAIHWMTTARTSQLIVRETEAEDQRRITIMLSTIAPDDRDALFEQSVTLVASLLWQLSQKSYPLRLIVDGDDSGLGSGSDHLLAMLRLLALCERRTPGQSDRPLVDTIAALSHDAERGYTVAIMPWSDPDYPAAMAAADRILHAPQIEELTHAF